MGKKSSPTKARAIAHPETSAIPPHIPPDEWPDSLLRAMSMPHRFTPIEDVVAWDSDGRKLRGAPATAPSKTIAAFFLRRIANEAHRPVADPLARADTLRMIADCIEGKVRWRKGPKYPIDVALKINEAAYNVEHFRPSHLSVNAYLNLHARFLAWELGRAHEQDAEQELRESVEQARKALRKHEREKSEK